MAKFSEKARKDFRGQPTVFVQLYDFGSIYSMQDSVVISIILSVRPHVRPLLIQRVIPESKLPLEERSLR